MNIRKAHSFPPSSLDRRFTEFIVSPKKVVGCRGGSRNVEGIPWKIGKLPNVHFMFLIDMKFISNILKMFLRGSSSVPGARLRFSNFSKFSNFKIPQCPKRKDEISEFRTTKFERLQNRNSQFQSFKLSS